MKTIFTTAFFLIFTAAAFCGGTSELANTQEIALSGVTDLRIICSFEDITVYKGNTNTLVIKEYMSEIDNKYFSVVNKYGNTLTIESGQVPVKPLFKNFYRRLEIFVPVSYKNIINIKTSSGNIELPDIICSGLNLVTTGGEISANSIKADTIQLHTTSGNVNLILPRNFQFKFSSKSASGKLTTPFSDRLSPSADDKDVTQGVICDNVSGTGTIPSIDIKTTSGDIIVEWR